MVFRCRIFFFALLSVALIACGAPAGRRASRVTSPSSGTPIAIATGVQGGSCSTAKPAAALQRGSRVSTISAAYRDLLAQYFRPIDPSPLLDAAWQGATDEVNREEGHPTALALPNLPSEQADADWQTFANAYGKLSDATEGKVDQVQLAFASVSQMAASLQEGHTYFLPPDAFSQEGKEQQLSGIGVVVTGRGAPYTITDVVPGGPAARAGVRAGDTITAVGGCSAASLDVAQLSQLIRGKAGTQVELTLGRAGAASQRLTITRAQVTFPLLETQLLPDKVGLVRLDSFPSPTTKLQDGHTVTQDLASALAAFRSHGAGAWILDLRGNPGGEVDGLQAIAGLLLPSGTIFSFADRSGTKQAIRTEGTRIGSPRLRAVLVDGGTASAGEILTSAIQEEGVAPIIGEKTAGIANGAELESLPGGAGLSITHFQTYTVNGTPLNGAGVTPNITVDRTPANVSAGVDPQLQRAEQVATGG